ncbi:MAG: hypothetical protein OHK0032_03570 [Thermodesulfovibrionales bacterium]
MRHLSNTGGFIKPLLCLAVLAIIGYAGFQFGMPYYRYSAFKNEVKEIARLELGSVEKIKTQVYEAAEGLKIPIEKEDIVVIRKKNTVRVQTSWSVNVDILGLYQRTLNFKIDIEE